MADLVEDLFSVVVDCENCRPLCISVMDLIEKWCEEDHQWATMVGGFDVLDVLLRNDNHSVWTRADEILAKYH
jgi:hypothetical protein